MIPSTASGAAIEGCGGVPPIRPLETLHNALSLRQLDAFLEVMTAAPLFRTPASSPPKCPATPSGTAIGSGSCAGGTGASGSSGGAVGGVATMGQTQYHPPLRLQSPSNSVGWSGPPSFVSSSGPSSPGASGSGSFVPDLFGAGSIGAGVVTGTGSGDIRTGDDLSSLSASLVSSDGYTDIAASLAHMFPPVLDQDLSSVGILLEEDAGPSGVVASVPICGSPLNIQNKLSAATAGDSGEVTPVSVSASSEFDFGSESHKEPKEPVRQKCRSTEEEDPKPTPEKDYSLDFAVSVPLPSVPKTASSTSLRGLNKTVESMAMVERRGRVGSCLGTKFVGRWVMESNENLGAFGHGGVEGEDFFSDAVPQADEVATTSVMNTALETPGDGVGSAEGLGLPGGLEPDAADEEDRTITSSMTATSPARKSIFQVFGSPVSRPLPSSVLSTSAGKESKLSTSLTPSTESDITQIEVEFTKPQSALSMSLKSPPIEEVPLGTSPLPSIPASPGAAPSVRRPPTKTPVISAFSREFRVYSSSKAGSLSSEVSLPSPSPTADLPVVTPEESQAIAGPSEPASAPGTSSSSDALSSIKALEGNSPSQASAVSYSSHSTAPLLTLASSLTDKPCIQRGFKVVKEQ